MKEQMERERTVGEEKGNRDTGSDRVKGRGRVYIRVKPGKRERGKRNGAQKGQRE